MKNTFGILGSGMQGTAAAYDLAKFAAPARIYVGDIDLHQAKKSADRVNALTGDLICEPIEVNALDKDSLANFLNDVDIVLSCVPYWMHPMVADVAVSTMTDMVDLGGNTEVTMKTLDMDERAKAADVTLVPDTGLAPGLVNNLGCYIIESLDHCDFVKLYCGVLPQNPKPPFNYKVTFNVEGLVTEYDYEAVALRDGKIIKIPTLTEVETLEIDQLGTMEAFVTSGGTSTAPYTFQGKVPNYEYKTIRHPGHAHLMKIFKDFGFWNESEVRVKEKAIVPKDVFNAVFGPELAKYEDRDLCAVRGLGSGTRGGKKTTVQIDIFDKQCETTDFTSMERLTGFSMSIIAQEVVNGKVAKGAVRYENAMTGKDFMRELQRRDFNVKIKETIEL
ncbi:MAG: saccharopine dehydrogenase NADP-binding domain-containing protein [Chthonomonadaceae bacterium]|nr:saccharopine dehydrogenase NADP-binding domain-containing protein [Chthonomonadaceae bacterium]